MHTFWRAVGGFFLGLIATYLAVVAGMLWYVEVNHVADREGGMSMGIVFVMGPLLGIVGGIISAIALPVWLGRRDKARTAGTLPPAKRWPLPVRVAISAIVAAAVVYYAAWSALWVSGPMAFDTYWAAYAVGNLPRVLGLAAAAITAWLVYRKG